jgi:hypothetical protein
MAAWHHANIKAAAARRMRVLVIAMLVGRSREPADEPHSPDQDSDIWICGKRYRFQRSDYVLRSHVTVNDVSPGHKEM